MSSAQPDDQTRTAPARRGARVYLAGSIVAQACALVRYTLLARLLGPEQLGLAATVILTQQFFESLSDSGADRFAIQDKDGDTPEVQRMLQAVLLGRGALTALGLLLFSGLIAAFYKAPPLAPALMLLAISPLIAGAFNLDLRRTQRHHDFRIEGVATIVGESLGLLAMVVAALAIHNFTCVIFGLITKSVVVVAVSHLMAERRYALGFSREQGPRFARFAIPLMINGLCFFLGSQGDRILIGNRLGLAELGHYSAVLLLIFSPASLATRYMVTMHLPRIAAGRDDQAIADRASDALGGLTFLMALAMAAGFAVVAPPAVVILYGHKFAMPAVIICLIGVLQMSRFMRLWPSTTALAMGRSATVLSDNLSRMTGLGFALVGAATVGGLAGAIPGLICGELLALVVTKALLNRGDGRPLLHGFGRIALWVGCCAALFAWAWILQHPSLVGVVLCAAATAVLVLRIVQTERRTLQEVLEQLDRGLSRLRRLQQRQRDVPPAGADGASAADAENRMA
jgi:O-antigen/teichoic acid export membrane protein